MAHLKANRELACLSYQAHFAPLLLFPSPIGADAKPAEYNESGQTIHQDTLAEWLTRGPAKAVSFGRAGSNPAGVEFFMRYDPKPPTTLFIDRLVLSTILL